MNTLEQKLLPIARKWSGNIPIWEVREAGIDPSAVRHWAADNPTVTHPARGMYTWLDPELDFDWETTDTARCVAQGGKNAYLWGPSVLELMELGEVGGYYTYVAVPTRRRAQDDIRWIPSADTSISVYRNIPIQSLPDALTASMPMLDPRKQASVLDAVEREHPECRAMVGQLAGQYGFDDGHLSGVTVVNGR
ncbi:hypothetical protein [Bifidobacterium animalis]|uniref:hypothetical protein n=1 Tax=Bifidobacterium animalis TaxID=28025 RepID=UPI001C3F0331|nr:hypothetical protein [Bifidobacterium animalis]